MKRNIANEKEFDEKLKQLGDLYEEGKGLVQGISFFKHITEMENTKIRLFKIIQEMRDLAATQMQAIHWQEEN